MSPKRKPAADFRQPIYAESPLGAQFSQLVDSSGAGTATYNMATTAAVYTVKPPSDQEYSLNRINFYIEGAVNAKFGADTYTPAAALATGIIVSVENVAGTILQLTPSAIQKIGQWSLYAGVDMKFTAFPAGKADYCSVRWTFVKGGGAISLDGRAGQFLSVRVSDDLSALVEHSAIVQGQKFDL